MKNDFNAIMDDAKLEDAIQKLKVIARVFSGGLDEAPIDCDGPASHDAIRDMCRKYCDSHECQTCRIASLIEKEHACHEDWCIICAIATSAQPTEAMLTEVMRYEKEGDPKPRTYADDYFEHHPEAIALAIKKNGVRMPHICRVSHYEGVDTCPGGMTCLECWQKPMSER